MKQYISIYSFFLRILSSVGQLNQTWKSVIILMKPHVFPHLNKDLFFFICACQVCIRVMEVLHWILLRREFLSILTNFLLSIYTSIYSINILVTNFCPTNFYVCINDNATINPTLLRRRRGKWYQWLSWRLCIMLYCSIHTTSSIAVNGWQAGSTQFRA